LDGMARFSSTCPMSASPSTDSTNPCMSRNSGQGC
jgi:hypothetical protein